MIKELHKIFNGLDRYSFPFKDKEKDIPKNGIYIIFEKGELFENFDRIVRVGTHTGDKQLRSRLNQHFIKENKNRSIFRKNIGRCLLSKDQSVIGKQQCTVFGKQKYPVSVNKNNMFFFYTGSS